MKENNKPKPTYNREKSLKPPSSNKNGNPVPSIDNIQPPKDKCNSYLDGWYSALYAVKNILENGVETDNEQPEKCSNKCTFNGDYMDPKCKVCGSKME